MQNQISIPVTPSGAFCALMPDGSSSSGILLRRVSDNAPLKLLRRGMPMLHLAETGAALVPFNGAAVMLVTSYADAIAEGAEVCERPRGFIVGHGAPFANCCFGLP